MFINTFVDQDFVDRHKLFVVGKRMNKQRMVWEYYVKSRRAKDYRQMLLDALYHPPHIEIDSDKSTNSNLYLVHLFENKPLVKDFISNTMMGIEYLWGGPIQLETHEVASISPAGGQGSGSASEKESQKPDIKWQRVLYTMRDRKLSKVNL
jgi:stage V sporulation protein R